ELCDEQVRHLCARETFAVPSSQPLSRFQSVFEPANVYFQCPSVSPLQAALAQTLLPSSRFHERPQHPGRGALALLRLPLAALAPGRAPFPLRSTAIGFGRAG